MLFPPGREKSKKLHQLIRYVINRMKLYYCRYHLICFDMENLIYFQDALPRISAFVWAAVIVLSAFLAYEVLWRRKHPQVAAGRADEAEKKACARRLSLVLLGAASRRFGRCLAEPVVEKIKFVIKKNARGSTAGVFFQNKCRQTVRVRQCNGRCRCFGRRRRACSCGCR